MPTIDDTIALVRKAHAGQTDKAGEPYVEHLLRVYERARKRLNELAVSIDAQERDEILHAALLHDIVEDTEHTFEQLRAMGYADATVRRVALLTREEDGRPYQEEIEEIAGSGDLGAIVIKLSDNEDNSDQVRVSKLPEGNPERLERYRQSMETLRAALERLQGGSAPTGTKMAPSEKNP